MHPGNPVNRVRDGGVQLELPPRVRRAGADYESLVSVLATTATNAQRRYSDEAGSAPRSQPLR
jgi:phage replication-related protein YjqB (UPF0714/DUF867 family)